MALAQIVNSIAEHSIPLALRLAQGNLTGNPNASVGINDSGDRQKALDIAAHDHFLAAMRGCSVARMVSEEAAEVITLKQDGLFDLAIDPVDGSGSIGIGAPLGTLFCIFPAGESFDRPGREIVAAGYVSFGHSVDFGFSLGNGVTIATLEPLSGQFHIDQPSVSLAPDTTTIAFNASNYRHWAPGLQRYCDDLVQGADGPRGRDFNMRWIAAAVGDLHRILRRGGVFLYPADKRPGYDAGFLRLLYEAFPIAFLIEQAGGAATDGCIPILDLSANQLHMRVPLVFGSRAEVATLGTYLTTSTPQET